ncbi:MAG TPA: hypothetical protein PKC95_00240 [Thauera aminoaromatica]|nr:hypothetical protein [Thauera aminoaromatica]
MPSLQLPIHSYAQPSRAPARLVNCFAQQTVGKQPVELLGAPGIVSWCTLGGAGRGLYVMRGTLYAVAGSTLYKIDEHGGATSLGAVSGSGKLMFAGNGVEIVLSNKSIFANGTVSAITDPDLPAISAIGYLDGYVVYSESGTGKWGCSELYSGATYDALDFASAEAYPDDLVTLAVDHRQVLLFGQETTEIWWNSGAGAGFPFERLAGGFIEYGCLSVHGVAKQDNSVFWLANDRTIRRLTGQTPVRVSQHGVEEKLASYARVDDCEAFPFSWNGHLFVVFRFPEAGATWVLDVTTGEWHERATYGASAWDVRDAVYCYGRVFAQQASTGAVGYLSDTCYTEFDGTLRREWTYPAVYATNVPLVHSQLDLICRTGDAPTALVPHVNLEISDDGGNTWLLLPPRELGRTGQYGHVIRWNRLGQARDRVYRMSIDDAAVPVRVTDTTLRTE